MHGVRKQQELAVAGRVLACLSPCLALVLVACSGSDGQEEGPSAPPPAVDVTVHVKENTPRPPEVKEEPDPRPAPRPKRPIPPVLRVSTWVNTPVLGPEAFTGKVVILDFWSTANGASRRLMPRLQALLHKHEAKGLRLIGVTEDPEEDVRRFADAQGIRYPLAVDARPKGRKAAFEEYGIEAIPTVWVLGRYGEVAWKGKGEDLSEALLLEELARKGPPEGGTP